MSKWWTKLWGIYFAHNVFFVYLHELIRNYFIKLITTCSLHWQSLIFVRNKIVALKKWSDSHSTEINNTEQPDKIKTFTTLLQEEIYFSVSPHSSSDERW